MLKKILAVLAMLYAVASFAAVDVNKATAAELDAVKGIGPTTSKAIVAERKKGDFKSWEDLISRVKGIGDTKATNLSKEGLTVSGATFTKADAKAAKKDAKEEKKEAKAAAKEEKKETKAEKKEEKKEEKAMAKADKKDDKKTADAKPAASAKK
jgi:competence protein ComEA